MVQIGLANESPENSVATSIKYAMRASSYDRVAMKPRRIFSQICILGMTLQSATSSDIKLLSWTFDHLCDRVTTLDMLAHMQFEIIASLSYQYP